MCPVPLIDEWSVLSADHHLALLHRVHYGKIEYGVFFSYRVFVNDFKQYSKKSYEQIDGSALHGRIRKRRIDKQIYVGEMHKLLGVSYSQYIKIENGAYQLHHMDKLKRLCEILDIAPEEIYTPYQIFIMNNQGKQIKAYRKANGLTQTELAERLFVHRKTVSKWENNTSQMPVEKWEEFSGATNKKYAAAE